MKINWKVRFRSRTFWVTFVPALLLAVQAVLPVFGYELKQDVSDQILKAFNTVLVVLTISGVVIDHTTDGISDSTQAMTYKEPKEDDSGWLN